MNETITQKLANAIVLQDNGEDGILYLAKNCSMLELAQLKNRYPAVTLGHDLAEKAISIQDILARQGQQIRIT